MLLTFSCISGGIHGYFKWQSKKEMFYATIMVKLYYLPAGANCATLISHRLTPSFIHPFHIFGLDLSPFFGESEEAYFII